MACHNLLRYFPWKYMKPKLSSLLWAVGTCHSIKHMDRKEHLTANDLVFKRIPTIRYFNKYMLVYMNLKKKLHSLFTAQRTNQTPHPLLSVYSPITTADYSTPGSFKQYYQLDAMKLWTFKTTGTFYGLMTCSKIWHEYFIALFITIFGIITEDMDNSLSNWYNLLYFQLSVALLWSSHYGWADVLHTHMLICYFLKNHLRLDTIKVHFSDFLERLSDVV